MHGQNHINLSQSFSHEVAEASVTLTLLGFCSHIKAQPTFSACNIVQPDERGRRLICKDSPKLSLQIHTQSYLLAPRLLDHFSDVCVEQEV